MSPAACGRTNDTELVTTTTARFPRQKKGGYSEARTLTDTRPSGAGEAAKRRSQTAATAHHRGRKRDIRPPQRRSFRFHHGSADRTFFSADLSVIFARLSER